MRGLGVPRQQRTWSPALYPLTAAPGGALAVVTRQDCARCTVTQTEFLIGADGSVRRTARLTLARDQHTSTPALGSASASWVLTWPRSGRCTLRLEPGSRPAVAVPCGKLARRHARGGGDLARQRGDARRSETGRVRERFAVHGQFDVISTNVALISTAPGIPGEGDAYPTDLTLVNLWTGARSHLRWPSTLHFGYRVFPEPHGSLVAVEFADPAYLHSGRRASDVWLRTRVPARSRTCPGSRSSSTSNSPTSRGRATTVSSWSHKAAGAPRSAYGAPAAPNSEWPRCRIRRLLTVRAAEPIAQRSSRQQPARRDAIGPASLTTRTSALRHLRCDAGRPATRGEATSVSQLKTPLLSPAGHRAADCRSGLVADQAEDGRQRADQPSLDREASL